MGKGIVFIPDAEDIGVFYSNSNKNKGKKKVVREEYL